MFFKQNKNILEIESTRERILVGEIDMSKKALESPDFDELFEFDSKVDGWSSPKITISGNYSINGDELLLISGTLTITINNTLNPITYLKFGTSTLGISAGTNIISDIPYAFSTSFGMRTFLIACNSQFQITGYNIVTIFYLHTLKNLCGFFDVWYGSNNQYNTHSLTGFEDSYPSDRSNKIIKQDRKKIYQDYYTVRRLKSNPNYTSPIRFLSRYTKSINFYEDVLKNYSSINDIRIDSNRVSHPFLEEINLHGYSCYFVKDVGSKGSTIINIYPRVGVIANKPQFRIDSNKPFGVGLGEVNLPPDFMEDIWLNNLTYGTENVDPNFNNIPIRKLLSNSVKKIQISGRTGDFDFSNISGFTFTQLESFIIYMNSMTGTDFDFSNQHIPCINFSLTYDAGTFPPTNIKSGTITLKNEINYEFYELRFYGNQMTVTDGSGYSFGWDLILPQSVKMIDHKNPSSDSIFLVMGQIASVGIIQPTIIPILTVGALKNHIWYYVQHSGSVINKIILEDILYKSLKISIGVDDPSTIDVSQFYIENIEYALNILTPTTSVSFLRLYKIPLNSQLSKIHYYFKEIDSRASYIDDTFNFENDVLLDDSYCERFYFGTASSQSHYRNFKLPKLTKLIQGFIISYDTSTMGDFDMTDINIRPCDSDTFISGSLFGFCTGTSSRRAVTFKLSDPEPQNVNNHTANSITLSAVILNFRDFKLGQRLIANSFSLYFSNYQCIEFIDQIYSNYTKFKPRPESLLQDTSDYAKVISRYAPHWSMTWQTMALFLNNNEMPKPLNYIQADSLTEGNDGEIVCPKNQIINNGFIEFINSNQINLDFNILEYETPAKVTFNLSFLGDLVNENPEDYLVLIKDSVNGYNPTGSGGGYFIFKNQVLYNGDVQFYGWMGYPNENYIISSFDENGISEFRFVPKGKIYYYILKYKKPGGRTDQGYVTLNDSLYCGAIDLISDEVVNVQLNKVRHLTFTPSFYYDGVLVTTPTRTVLSIYSNGAPIETNCGTSVTKLPFIEGNNTFKFVYRFYNLGVTNLIEREFSIKLNDETVLNQDFFVLSTDFKNITRSPLLTGTHPELSIDGLQGTQLTTTPIAVEAATEVRIIRQPFDPFSAWAVGWKKIVITDNYEVDFPEYPLAFPNNGVVGNRFMRFLDGSIKAQGENVYHVYSAYNIYIIEDLGFGEEETLLWTGNNANNLPSKYYTKFRVEFSFVYKMLCMYYQYAYRLIYQKKDFTEILKYRWSVTT